MNSTMKYKICRLCLCGDEQKVDISEERIQMEFLVEDAIQDLLNVKVVKETVYPWLVCLQCIYKLNDFRVYKHRCLESQNLFQNCTDNEEVLEAEERTEDEAAIQIGSYNSDEEDVEMIIPDEIPVMLIKKEDAKEFPVTSVSKKVPECDVIDLCPSEEEITIKSEFEGDKTDAGGMHRAHTAEAQGANVGRDETADLHYGEDGGMVERAHHLSCKVAGDVGLRKGQKREKKCACKGKMFTCDICSRSYKRLASLKLHKMTHIPVRPFTCDKCSAAFKYKSSLNAHLSTHSGDRPFSCEVCSKSFKLTSSLKVHRRIHTGEKPFKCEMCFKAFAQKSTFDSHIRSHSEEKPFSCDLCSKSFKHKVKLKLHRMTHDGAKPFTCNVCFKAFLHKEYLTKHLRSHTNLAPFSCDTCSKSYKHMNSLVEHKRTHTV